MTTLIAEENVSRDALLSHLKTAGLDPTPVYDDQIHIHTQSGFGFRITVLTDKPFLHFGTYFLLDGEKSREEKAALVVRMNGRIFLPTFSLDEEDDLTMGYVMPYRNGLIDQQFVALVRRFQSLMEYVAHRFDTDGLIDVTRQTNGNDGTQPVAGPSTIH